MPSLRNQKRAAAKRIDVDARASLAAEAARKKLRSAAEADRKRVARAAGKVKKVSKDAPARAAEATRKRTSRAAQEAACQQGDEVARTRKAATATRNKAQHRGTRAAEEAACQQGDEAARGRKAATTARVVAQKRSVRALSKEARANFNPDALAAAAKEAARKRAARKKELDLYDERMLFDPANLSDYYESDASIYTRNSGRLAPLRAVKASFREKFLGFMDDVRSGTKIHVGFTTPAQATTPSMQASAWRSPACSTRLGALI